MKRGSRSAGSRWSINILRFGTNEKHVREAEDPREQWGVVPSLDRLSIPRERRLLLLGSLQLVPLPATPFGGKRMYRA